MHSPKYLYYKKREKIKSKELSILTQKVRKRKLKQEKCKGENRKAEINGFIKQKKL